MSSIIPSPIGPATTAKRGTMSAVDKTKVDAVTGTNTGDVTVASPAGWLSQVGQALTFALVAAGAAVDGVVSQVAQSFAGVKTFVAEAVFGAGLVATGVRAIGASLLLRSDMGAGATDVCNTIGTSVAYGSANAAAKIWCVAAGIGATQVNLHWATKSTLNSPRYSGTDGYASSYFQCDSGATRISYAGVELQLTGSSFAFNNGVTYAWSVTAAGAFNGLGVVLTGTAQLGTAGTARPTAAAENRGTLWYSKSAGGAADTVQICLKSAADTYSWVTISTG